MPVQCTSKFRSLPPVQRTVKSSGLDETPHFDFFRSIMSYSLIPENYRVRLEEGGYSAESIPQSSDPIRWSGVRTACNFSHPDIDIIINALYPPIEPNQSDPSILPQTILAKLDVIEEKVNEVQEVQFVQSKSIGLMSKEIAINFKKRMDIWGSDKRTRVEQEDFKNSLVAFYQRQSASNQNLKCMILNIDLPRNKVRGSHIWKFCTEGEGLEEFGLETTDLSSPRNGILLSEKIEEAFDKKRICFLIDRIHPEEILLKVLDPNIRSEVILSPHTNHTFNSIDGMELQHPPGCLPFRRILDFHAKLSFEKAIRKGWILRTETVTSFFDLSLNASIPDLDQYDEFIDLENEH